MKTNYDDIRNLFVERYPSNGTSTDFPQDAVREFTKERFDENKGVAAKVMLDSGRRSGGGKIVAQFYGKCSEVWGGYPATNAFTNGIDTSDQTISLAESRESVIGAVQIAAGDNETSDEMVPPNPVGPETP